VVQDAQELLRLLLDRLHSEHVHPEIALAPAEDPLPAASPDLPLRPLSRAAAKAAAQRAEAVRVATTPAPAAAAAAAAAARVVETVGAKRARKGAAAAGSFVTQTFQGRLLSEVGREEFRGAVGC
jgi:hypothetical protein